MITYKGFTAVQTKSPVGWAITYNGNDCGWTCGIAKKWAKGFIDSIIKERTANVR